MPTYQYACRSCGHRFEVVQSMAEEPLTACPECGGELRKVYAPPAIAFRGSGFYATDHGKRKAKDGSDGAPTKEGASPTKGGTGDAAKGEAAKDRGTRGDGSKADGGGSTSKGRDGAASSTGGEVTKGDKG